MKRTKNTKYVNCKNIYKKILSTLTIAIIGLSTTISSGFANTEDRGLGEIVVINGEQRPDLTSHFDFLRQNTVMMRGLVFAVDSEGNITIPKELEQEVQENIEQKKQIAEEREKTIIKTSTKPSCYRCDVCGLQYCTTTRCSFCGNYKACGGTGANPGPPHQCP